MTEEFVTVEGLLPASYLEQLVGKRQSIIFALLLALFACIYLKESTIAATLVGFIGLVVKDYVDDVNEERKI